MRLTTMTDYALRLLMHVAQHPQRLCTIAEVARAYGISEAHLMKVTHQLAQGGWLQTLRGKGGGMRLAMAPSQVRLGAVVRSVEPDFQLVHCHGAPAGGCTLAGSCALPAVFDGALSKFLDHLDAHTLADVLPTRRADPPPPPPALPLQPRVRLHPPAAA